MNKGAVNLNAEETKEYQERMRTAMAEDKAQKVDQTLDMEIMDKKSKKKKIFFGLGIVGILGIIGGVLIGLSKSGDDEDDEESEEDDDSDDIDIPEEE